MKRQHIYGNLILMAALVMISMSTARGQTTADEPIQITDEKVEATVKVYFKMVEIQKEYGPKVKTAGNPQQAQQLRQEAVAKMQEIFDDQDDLSLKEYNHILKTAENDSALEERLVAAAEKYQKEQGKKETN